MVNMILMGKIIIYKFQANSRANLVNLLFLEERLIFNTQKLFQLKKTKLFISHQIILSETKVDRNNLKVVKIIFLIIQIANRSSLRFSKRNNLSCPNISQNKCLKIIKIIFAVEIL